MKQVRKRLRKNENSNGKADSSDTNLPNADQELVQTIPILVSEIFLEELRDVKLLKTCRLVCKSWYIAASKSLRACSVVSLKENSSKLEHFASLLRKRELRSFQHFPSPFQNFHVEGRSFTEPTFLNLVFTPNFICTRLRVLLPDEDGVDLDQSQFSLFLAINKDSILDLIITGKNNPGFELNETLVNDAVQLTSLKSFKFSDHCRRCPHIQFVQNILRMCRPIHLDLSIRDYRSFPSLLLQDQVTHIKDLRLSSRKFSGNVFTHLANTRFQLRTLSVLDNGFIYDQYLEEWFSFLENVSHSLVHFRTNLPMGTELRFPKSREIHIRNDENVLSTFTPNNFPALKKIILDVEEPILPSLENCEDPHKGVQCCVIEAPDMTLNYDEDHELFMLLTFVSRQFPQVTSFDISV